MPRLVLQSRAPSRDDRGCPSCHRRHSEHLPCIGNPSDWNAEACARVPHRELDQPLLGFISSLEYSESPDWIRRLARALERRDPDIRTIWVVDGGYDIAADRVLYVVPQMMRIELRCGVAERLGIGLTLGYSRMTVTGPMTLRPNIEASVLIGMTGLYFLASSTGKGEMTAIDESSGGPPRIESTQEHTA